MRRAARCAGTWWPVACRGVEWRRMEGASRRRRRHPVPTRLFGRSPVAACAGTTAPIARRRPSGMEQGGWSRGGWRLGSGAECRGRLGGAGAVVVASRAAPWGPALASSCTLCWPHAGTLPGARSRAFRRRTLTAADDLAWRRRRHRPRQAGGLVGGLSMAAGPAMGCDLRRLADRVIAIWLCWGGERSVVGWGMLAAVPRPIPAAG